MTTFIFATQPEYAGGRTCTHSDLTNQSLCKDIQITSSADNLQCLQSLCPILSTSFITADVSFIRNSTEAATAIDCIQVAGGCWPCVLFSLQYKPCHPHCVAGAVALPGAALARFLSTEMEKSWKRQAKTDQAAFKLVCSDLIKTIWPASHCSSPNVTQSRMLLNH